MNQQKFREIPFKPFRFEIGKARAVRGSDDEHDEEDTEDAKESDAESSEEEDANEQPIKCPGCGKVYPGHKVNALIDHCFQGCRKYKEDAFYEETVLVCFKCEKVFPDANTFDRHITNLDCLGAESNIPRLDVTEGLSIAIIKKKWIQPGGYLCDGCDAFFASERVKVFIKHCLMECRKFDKLGLALACLDCMKLFPDDYLYGIHYQKSTCSLSALRQCKKMQLKKIFDEDSSDEDAEGTGDAETPIAQQAEELEQETPEEQEEAASTNFGAVPLSRQSSSGGEQTPSPGMPPPMYQTLYGRQPTGDVSGQLPQGWPYYGHQMPPQLPMYGQQWPYYQGYNVAHARMYQPGMEHQLVQMQINPHQDEKTAQTPEISVQYSHLTSPMYMPNTTFHPGYDQHTSFDGAGAEGSYQGVYGRQITNQALYRKFANECAQLYCELDYQAMMSKAPSIIGSLRMTHGDQANMLYEMVFEMATPTGWHLLADRTASTIVLVSWAEEGGKKYKRGNMFLISASRVQGGMFDHKPTKKEECDLSTINAKIVRYGRWLVDDESRARMLKGMKCAFPDAEGMFFRTCSPQASAAARGSYESNVQMNEVSDVNKTKVGFKLPYIGGFSVSRSSGANYRNFN